MFLFREENIFIEDGDERRIKDNSSLYNGRISTDLWVSAKLLLLLLAAAEMLLLLALLWKCRCWS